MRRVLKKIGDEDSFTNDHDLILVLPWLCLFVKNAQFLHEGRKVDDNYRE